MRILIIDPSEIFRKGIRALLEENFKVELFGEAGSYPVLLETINFKIWDIIILDIEFPDKDGLEILKIIKGINPNVPVLVITNYLPEQFVVRTFKAGSTGFLSKNSYCEEIVQAVKVILSGKKYINAVASDYLSKTFNKNNSELIDSLSDREYYIFLRIAEGNTVSEIASELSLSVKTISHYRKNILLKMNLKNNAGIMRYAFANKLVK